MTIKINAEKLQRVLDALQTNMSEGCVSVEVTVGKVDDIYYTIKAYSKKEARGRIANLWPKWKCFT